MEEPTSKPLTLAPTRAGLAVLAAAMALLLILTVVVAARQAADFGGSYKTGPLFARKNDEILYTIVVKNTGDPVQGVVLSDTLPDATTLVTLSCVYLREGSYYKACGPFDRLWREYFDTGDRITTYFKVVVTADTAQWPLTNCAYLSWGGEQMEMCHKTTVNPLETFLPIVVHDG